MTPTARTLKALRDAGWTAGVVEKWNPHVKIRQDFLACIDIIAVRPGETLGVQATVGDSAASRVNKIKESEGARAWLSGGNALAIYGWRKLKKPKSRQKWFPRIIYLSLVNGSLLTEAENDRSEKLILAIESFMRESSGVIGMSAEHDTRLTNARDALHRAMLDAKFDGPERRLPAWKATGGER